MPMSRNPNVFRDVKAVFDAALQRGRVRYPRPTRGQAVHWRQRAYHYRTLLYQIKMESYSHIPGYTTSTPYDKLIIKLDGNDVVVEVSDGLDAQILDDDGNPIEPPVESEMTEDELEMARQVASDLDLDVEE